MGAVSVTDSVRPARGLPQPALTLTYPCPANLWHGLSTLVLLHPLVLGLAPLDHPSFSVSTSLSPSLSLCPPLILLSLSLSLPPFTPPSAPSSHALPRHHSTHPHSFTSTSQRVHMLEVRQRAAACILSFPSNLSATATAPRIPPLAAARHPDSTTTPCQWQRAAPRVEHSLFPSLKF